MEGHLHGVSTRKFDDLARRWAPTPASARARRRGSEPNWTRKSRLPGPSAGRHRVLLRALDATHCKARVNRRVVSQAVVVATGSGRWPPKVSDTRSAAQQALIGSSFKPQTRGGTPPAWTRRLQRV